MNRLRREYTSPAGGYFGEIFLSIYFSWINLTPFSHLFHRMFTVFPDTGVQKMQENDVQNIDVLSLLTVDKVYVEAGDTVSTKIKSSVSGRVKKINVAKGDGVTDVMQEDGALALISLDGKMAVEITAASEHLSGVFCVAMHMNNDPVDHFCVLRVSTGYAKKRHLQRMQKK